MRFASSDHLNRLIGFSSAIPKMIAQSSFSIQQIKIRNDCAIFHFYFLAFLFFKKFLTASVLTLAFYKRSDTEKIFPAILIKKIKIARFFCFNFITVKKQNYL